MRPSTPRPTGDQLLEQLRERQDPRAWLEARQKWELIRITRTLVLHEGNGKRAYRKDELIDHILLAEWRRGAGVVVSSEPRQDRLF
jgi:hypothetical protein